MRILSRAILAIVCAFVFISYHNYCFAAQGVLGASKLIVDGDHWELLNEKNILTISDKVKAKSPKFELWCENLVVVFADKVDSSKSEETAQKIKK